MSKDEKKYAKEKTTSLQAQLASKKARLSSQRTTSDIPEKTQEQELTNLGQQNQQQDVKSENIAPPTTPKTRQGTRNKVQSWSETLSAAKKKKAGEEKGNEQAERELKEKEEKERLEREKEEEKKGYTDGLTHEHIEITHKNNHNKKPLLKNSNRSTDLGVPVEKLEQDGQSALEQTTKASHNRSVSFIQEERLLHIDPTDLGSKVTIVKPMIELAEQYDQKQEAAPKQDKEEPQKLNHNQEPIQEKPQEQAQKQPQEQPQQHHHGKKKHQAATVTVDDTRAIEALKAEIKKWSEQGKTDVVKGLQRELATKERKQNKRSSAIKSDTPTTEKAGVNVQPDDKTQSARSAATAAPLAQKAESTPSKNRVAALRESFESKAKSQGQWQEKTQFNDPVLKAGNVKKALEQFNETPAAKALQETQKRSFSEAPANLSRKGPKKDEGMSR